ncbi:hypothetical protein BACT_0747 [Bifidobacterium actinocoloniiforme DSM 22766]|uniref:Tryptophan-rich sensory protein n=1 Tax=Bifidobacterium actinocoloniiforme DSM 22766 TaxID=1437605 RepID=A0A086Z0J5_9BIFI|nr:TspO/MBR family protein [Bifidobacterium actinocoloniiforme]AKV55270.1 hypothetical protein AB656_02340 [Bifidobacterium actinocoloniiforme DSM 22766]KFI40045.1 hypothetical protein BACT_0747 [Bifidobacterium actinocoloniiforme DSM 22766]
MGTYGPSEQKEASTTPKAGSGQGVRAQESRTPSALESERQAEGSVARADDAHAKHRRLIESIVLWAAWLIMVAFNGYAEIFHLNGVNVGQVAHEGNVWFMPAGWAFAIWGLIYIVLALWLIRFCLAGPSRKALGPLPFSLSGLLFVATCALNIAWLACWHFRAFTASLLIIVVLTALTWVLYGIVRRDQHEEDTAKAARILDWTPLSLYASWLTIATLLNACYTVQVLSGGVSDIIQIFTVVILLVLLLIAVFLMQQKAGDWVCGLVLLWSGLAIGINILSRSVAVGVLVIALTALGEALAYFPWSTFKLVRR